MVILFFVFLHSLEKRNAFTHYLVSSYIFFLNKDFNDSKVEDLQIKFKDITVCREKKVFIINLQN